MTMNQRLEGEVDTSSVASRTGMVEGEVLRPPGPGPGPLGYDVQELWYRLLSRPWSCLVVVSPDRTPNTLRLASSLAELGTQHRRRLVEVVDGLQLDVERAAAIAHMVEPQEGLPTEPRFVIALDSPMVNPVAFGVLAAGDAVLMLLAKGVTRIPQARKIIEVVGRERLIGAVLAVE
jgi:hypothetical protein